MAAGLQRRGGQAGALRMRDAPGQLSVTRGQLPGLTFMVAYCSNLSNPMKMFCRGGAAPAAAGRCARGGRRRQAWEACWQRSRSAASPAELPSYTVPVRTMPHGLTPMQSPSLGAILPYFLLNWATAGTWRSLFFDIFERLRGRGGTAHACALAEAALESRQVSQPGTSASRGAVCTSQAVVAATAVAADAAGGSCLPATHSPQAPITNVCSLPSGQGAREQALKEL